MFAKNLISALLTLLLSSSLIQAQAISNGQSASPSLEQSEGASPVISLDGEWYGTITQYPRGLASTYDFGLFIQSSGGRIGGSSWIAMQDNSDWWGRMSIEGSAEEGLIQLTELEITSQNIVGWAYWCTKSLFLQVVNNDGQISLEGHWQSGDCNTSTGRIHLERVNL